MDYVIQELILSDHLMLFGKTQNAKELSQPSRIMWVIVMPSMVEEIAAESSVAVANKEGGGPAPQIPLLCSLLFFV